MEVLEKELGELKLFIADLKTDRAAQKEKEKREAWTKYVSMSIVFIAVLAAIATQRAGKYSSATLAELNHATFYQALASDKWSYYQANSIKQNLYEALHDQSPKDAVVANGTDTAKREEIFNAKVNKYKTTKSQTETEARELEAKRDKAQLAATDSSKHGGGMGMAVSIFQISIAMGSICLVTKKKWLWHVALLLALGATVQMARAWL